ncbi:MAG: succinate dehydrogenase cytochrome b subunit [Bacteroidota bacterium]
MSWLSNTISSTLGRKLVMAVTGIFLITFLVVHLIGNVSLITDPTGLAFNQYAHFMKTNPLIKLSEVILFAGFLFHSVDGILLMSKNRKARPVRYAVDNKSKTYSWTSKYMGPFGVVILVFLIIHLVDFFSYKYFRNDLLVKYMVDGTMIDDLSTKVYSSFANPLMVIFYTVSMVVIGLHLHHGFQSSFQSLGLNHKKYTPFIEKLGTAFAVIVPLGFALIPIIIFVNHIS